jgi:WD40 repeat protein
VLLAVNADGTASHWHMTSGKCLHTITEEDNQLFCVDYRPDGAVFATAGKDYCVRIYDEATKTLSTTLMGGRTADNPGHSNRVFSLKFKPDDPNLLISAGWDNTVQIWDLRIETSVKSIFGPHICGDAADICGDKILTGSWRPADQLEVWDFNTGKLLESIPWRGSADTSLGAPDPCMLYAAKFSNTGGGRLIGAGGSGANEAKVFDRKFGNKLVGTVQGMTRGVFSLDFAHDDSKVAVAGGDAAIRILNVVGCESAPVDINVGNFEVAAPAAGGAAASE